MESPSGFPKAYLQTVLPPRFTIEFPPSVAYLLLFFIKTLQTPSKRYTRFQLVLKGSSYIIFLLQTKCPFLKPNSVFLTAPGRFKENFSIAEIT